ncbi:VOC family protein [Chloroflexota bacterium]
MALTSPAKVKVTGINQVALVVKDLQKTMENYWNILGIGPWDVLSWEAPLVHHRQYHGKPAWAREKIAITRVGAVEFELCQPVEGDSIYRDFLMEHEEGLHHMNFLTDSLDDMDKTVEILAKEGFPCVQSGQFGSSNNIGAFSYVDTKPLRTIWEPVYDVESENVDTEITRYPDTAQASPAKVKVKGIGQVALVVKDLQKTMENYWNILGIGPWTVYSLDAHLLRNRRYHGKPAWASEKEALAQVGEVELELCQPIEGESIYQDFLTEHGEGLHHMNFLVDSADEVDNVTEVMAKEGFPCLQSAQFGSSDNIGAFSYIDIKPLRTIWEPVHKSENADAEIARYPEESA